MGAALRPGALIPAIEAMGIRGAERHWSLLPPELARRSRARVERIGDSFATLMEKSASLRLNRAMGLGWRERPSRRVLDRLLDFYRSAGVARFTVRPSPGRWARMVERSLVERGLEPRPGTVLLARDCTLPTVTEDHAARVSKAAARHRKAIVAIHERVFGVPVAHREWAMAAAASSDNQYFLAFAGRTPIAVGALRVEGDLAWLGAGATLTRWRRRGAQTALIAARLRRAAELGCRWAWSEALVPRRGRPDGSRRNLMRMGFVELCRKTDFVGGTR